MPSWMQSTIAALGLLALLPLMLVIAALVRVTSPGPALFRQERVGRGGRRFQILKFRTMATRAADDGIRLTVGARDPRVTPVGAWLRKSKLDELPQLWNVVVGDMALVGPRPEVPEYVAHWDEATRALLLSCAPGITDPASLAFRNESELLATYDDPERAYIEIIAPQKLALSRRYVEQRSTRGDLALIAETLRVLVSRR